MCRDLRKKWFAAMLGVGVLLSGISGYGAELNVQGGYDGGEGRLSVRGTVREAADPEVTVVVIPYDRETEELTLEDIQAQGLVVNMARADSQGEFAMTMGLPDSWPGGLYKAVIHGDGAEQEIWFSYANAARAAGALARVNGAGADAMAALLREEAAALGIQPEHAAAYGSQIGRYLLAQRPAAGYPLSQFLDAYTGMLALAQIQAGDADTDTALARFASYLDVDIEKDYRAETGAVRQETERLLKTLGLEGESASAFYQRCLLLGRINKAESNLSLKNLLLDHAAQLGLSLSRYNSLTSDYQRNQACSRMLGGSFESYAQVSAAFDAACEAAAQENKSPGGSFGGGGGAGGSGGGNRGGGSTFGKGGATGGGGDYVNKPLSEDDGQGAASAALSDMAGHWAAAEVDALVQRGIVNGFPDGTFLPEQTVTRAEFSKLLCLGLGLEKTAYASSFADVSAGDWYAPYVLSLADAGIVTGYEAMFLPDDRISRQDAAAMLYRALKGQGRALSQSASFADEAEIADYAQAAVAALAGEGILQGYEGRFEPLGVTTRAQAAVMLYRVLGME